MACYKVSPEADEDIDRLWFFGLSRFGVAQADRYYYQLLSHFEDLAESPLLYPAVDHIRKGYRRSVCGVHSVYYRVHSDHIEIIRIIGAEDF